MVQKRIGGEIDLLVKSGLSGFQRKEGDDTDEQEEDHLTEKKRQGECHHCGSAVFGEGVERLVTQGEWRVETVVHPCQQIVDAHTQENDDKNRSDAVQGDDASQQSGGACNGAVNRQCQQEKEGKQVDQLCKQCNDLINYTGTHGICQNDLLKREEEKTVDERSDDGQKNDVKRKLFQSVLAERTGRLGKNLWGFG